MGGMPPRTSAALLLYRSPADPGQPWPPVDAVTVLLGHMGGPFWARRDHGGWSIPKGEYDADLEDPLVVARREFAEEIGVAAPDGAALDLGVHVQPSGKRIVAFAQHVVEQLAWVSSNEFQLEWPRGSGQVRGFPEVDRAEWFPLEAARSRLVPGQVPILDALAARLVAGPAVA